MLGDIAFDLLPPNGKCENGEPLAKFIRING
jgi:hypothetical protein